MMRTFDNYDELIKFLNEELNDYQHDMIEFQDKKIKVPKTYLDYVDIGLIKVRVYNNYLPKEGCSEIAKELV